MKIGILTQPIKMNYGGVLQAYALQKFLKEHGHDVRIINRCPSPSQCYISRKWNQYKALLKQTILFIFARQKFTDFRINVKSIFETTFEFSKKNVRPCSPSLYTDKELKKYILEEKFEVYIVGSDQVWRPCYSPNLYTYFLDFVSDVKDIRKIAYAASFGVDEWEFTEEETNRCITLINKFHYVSCREYSGVSMCRDYLKKADAEWVLDPTLLLSSNVYLSLIEKARLNLCMKKFLVTYILDESASKISVIDFVKEKLNLSIYNAKVGVTELQDKHLKGKATVEEWLYGFANADFAIVDSFHGCVFSIIFHTPFIAIKNKLRGNARFDSLIKLFNLENRIVDSVSEINDAHLKMMDWKNIDNILQREKLKSVNFLLNSLSNVF